MQASRHRVRLWHATKEIYRDLSDNSAHSDPIHLFPGQPAAVSLLCSHVYHHAYPPFLLPILCMLSSSSCIIKGQFISIYYRYTVAIQSMPLRGNQCCLPACQMLKAVSTHSVTLGSHGWCAEGVMTNGSGMVQFSRGFMLFAKNLPIVPVALRVTVPWNIQTHTLTSSFAANLFWFCFVPWVRLDATVLTPMSLAKVRAQHSA